MVTFECFVKTCPNCDIAYNSLGFPETAICGGCSAILEATNPQPDPEPQPTPVPEVVVKTTAKK
jgi:hypothetical protein